VILKLQEFAQLLRRNGVRVSTSEVIDATRSLVAVGVAERADLEAALRATLVKRPGDRRAFDELFALYFLRGGELARRLQGAPLLETLRGMGLSEEDLERIVAVLADQAAALGAVSRTLLGVRDADIAGLLRMAGVGGAGMRMISPLQVGWHAHRLLESMDVAGAERELERMLRMFADALGPAAAQALAQTIQQNLASLRQAVRRHVQEEFERQNYQDIQDFREKLLTRKAFSQLSEAEVQALRAEVKKLARKLRTQASLRPRIRRRGRLDVRRTIRRSLASGGVPFELRRRLRKVERPRLVVLCDVSDSVRNVSRFMLEFVYTLQELFERVRSFVFVSDLGETTDLFRRYDIDRAVALAYGGAVINVYANSNYGRALDTFVRRHGESVTSKTTVIVIGDGRNNYHPTHVDRLAELRRKAKRLIWINPETPASWGFGDSVMREYEPHCDRICVAVHLESLRKVVDDLVL
jgi:uncharacterized protein